MNAADLDLARRAVACKGWRWMAGMHVLPLLVGGRVEDVRGVIVGRFDEAMPLAWWPDLHGVRAHHPTQHLLPDLADPATLGCLLALVRERGDCPVAGLVNDPHPCGPRWVVLATWPAARVVAQGATEAEALVAALEGAR